MTAEAPLMRHGRCRVDQCDASARKQTETAEHIDMLLGFDVLSVRIVRSVFRVLSVICVLYVIGVSRTCPLTCRQPGRICGHGIRI